MTIDEYRRFVLEPAQQKLANYIYSESPYVTGRTAQDAPGTTNAPQCDQPRYVRDMSYWTGQGTSARQCDHNRGICLGHAVGQE